MAGAATKGAVYGVPVEYQNGINRLYTVPEIFGFLTAAGFTKEQAKVLTAIAHRESRYNDHARNPVDLTSAQSDGRVAVGLWQNMVTFTNEDALKYLYSPAKNAKVSHDKFVASVNAGFSGYRPWGFGSDADAQAFANSSGAYVPQQELSSGQKVLLALDPSKLNPITGWVGDLLTGIKNMLVPIGLGLLGALMVWWGIELLVGESKTFKGAVKGVEGIASSIPVVPV